MMTPGVSTVDDEVVDTEAIATGDTPERPSQERYQTLIEQRRKTADHLAELEFLAELEATDPPAGLGYDNLLEFRFPRAKNPGVPRGVKLVQQIDGTRAVLVVIDRGLDEWNAAETAYVEAQA